MAYISSEYGNALDSTATPSASGKIAGASSAVPLCAKPIGTIISAPITVPNEVICPPCAAPALRPNRM